eukprot:15473126-Alexandrium_andersonii.AAC.1
MLSGDTFRAPGPRSTQQGGIQSNQDASTRERILIGKPCSASAIIIAIAIRRGIAIRNHFKQGGPFLVVRRHDEGSYA